MSDIHVNFISGVNGMWHNGAYQEKFSTVRQASIQNGRDVGQHAAYLIIDDQFDSTLTCDEICELLLKAVGGSFFNGPSTARLVLGKWNESMTGNQKQYLDIIKHLQTVDPRWKNAPWRRLKVTVHDNSSSALTKPEGLNNEPYMFSLARLCDITWVIKPDSTTSIQLLKSYCHVSSDAYLYYEVQNMTDMERVDSSIRKYNAENLNLPVYIHLDTRLFETRNSIVNHVLSRGYNISTSISD